MKEQKKVLVTGAAGYIGRHVVKTFLDAGYQVLANDLNYKGVDQRANIVDVPIFQENNEIYHQLKEPDILIHLAWKDGFIHNSPAHMAELSKHVIFLQNMINGGLPSLSVMGSMHEIGYWIGKVDETTPCNPLSFYGIAKNALRQTLLLETEKKSVSMHWLRAYYIYGDEAHGSSIFSKIAQAVEDGKKTFPFTTGKNKYDFIDVDTLAEQILYASIQDEVQGIINVCSGKAIELGEQIEKFITKHHYDIQLEYGKYPERPYDSPAIWGDSKKIEKILGEKKRETMA